MSSPHYLAIGHVTEDVWRDGHSTPGGTAWFSSLAAQRLVPNVAVLTAAASTYNAADALPGIEAHIVPSPVTTQFENIYTPQGRTQYTRPSPVKLTSDLLTPELRGARIMHLAPVCDEVSVDFVTEVDDDVFIGVTPQGWLRRWDADGRVHAKPWAHAEAILARANATVISIDDVAGDWRTALRWAAMAAHVFVVTQSAAGCFLFLNGKPIHVPAPHVEEVEPTGAGDIFASSLYIALQRGDDPADACAFANCLAAQSVTRRGLDSLPTQDDIDRCGTIPHK
jgi:sugar/nucleoside kinase (ribokinase family)